jgi:hypothetical protein
MKKQKISSGNGENSSPLAQEPTNAKNKAEKWIELIYSNSLSPTMSWSKRVEEATRMLNYCPDEMEVRDLSIAYFRINRKYETYWSLVVMKHNVCNSLREVEASEEGASNENTSYKAKLENAMKLSAIELEIEKREVELFKGNNEIKDELLRVAGKGKSKYDGASLHDQLINGRGYE